MGFVVDRKSPTVYQVEILKNVSHMNYPQLYQTGQIGKLSLANCLIVAPMTRVSASPNGVPTEIMQEHYQAFAKGGWSLVLTEGTYIDEQHSQGYKNQPGIANSAHIEGWQSIVETVHAEGVLFFQQLIHAGALIQENIYVDQAIAPSPVDVVGSMMPHYFGEGGFPRPREMTKSDISQVIDAYAQAAQRSVAAGFDGVEIHGANGYLPDQFLTTLSNTRSDEYGGSVENMIRFTISTLPARISRLSVPLPSHSI